MERKNYFLFQKYSQMRTDTIASTSTGNNDAIETGSLCWLAGCVELVFVYLISLFYVTVFGDTRNTVTSKQRRCHGVDAVVIAFCAITTYHSDTHKNSHFSIDFINRVGLTFINVKLIDSHLNQKSQINNNAITLYGVSHIHNASLCYTTMT